MPSVPPERFEALYRTAPDPWDYLTSAYEREKYRDSLGALSRVRYRAGLEVGCSIGVLTGLLAARCAALLAIDCSETALQAARARHGDRPGLRFERRVVPGDFPPGRFDLIVLSELLYFLDLADLQRLAERSVAALEPAGEVLLVSWLGPTDTDLSGDAATEGFIAATAKALHVTRGARRKGYRLDLLTRG